MPVELLTLEVPDEQVLLCDFDYWHVVLKDGNLIFSMEEDKEYLEEEKRHTAFLRRLLCGKFARNG